MSPQEYTDRIVASGVLAAADIDAAIAKLSPGERPKDVAQLGRLLVQKGLLTRYQAAAIFQANTRGLVLGNYVVLDKIGAGGMGEVFKARHRVMERIVAIKVLPPSLIDSPEAVKRFHREVRAAARLIHPNIVTAFDAAEDKGVHFLAMEFVEGEDLAKIVDRDGPLPVTDAVDYMLQAADGLAYAHAQGMTHRDIKPHNLLLASGGRKSPDSSASASAIGRPQRVIKILDMGLARFETTIHGETTERLSITREDQIIGTVDYMSPEQAESTHSADQRSDIYSLGCTLYRLLTGQVPYAGDSAIKKLIAHREYPIPALRESRPDVPAGLQEAFARMMAKRPADRYSSMHEVIEALRPFGSAAQAAAEEAGGDAEVINEDSALFNFIQKHATGSPSRTGLPAASSIAKAAPAKAPAAKPATAAKPAPAAPAPRKPAVATPTEQVAVQQSKQDTGKVARAGRGREARKKKFPLGLVLGAAGVVGALVIGGVLLALMSYLSQPTKLVIEWPAAERASGQLIVDGQEVEVSDAQPWEIIVEPGVVALSAVRRGFEPIEQQFEVAAGQRHSVQLNWVALPSFETIAPSFDPDKTKNEVEMNARWPALFKQHQDKLAAQAAQRTAQLGEVKALIDDAAAAAIDAPATIAAEQAVRQFLQQHGGTPEAARLGSELARLASPADLLAREDIAPYELAAAGAGNPADAAAQLTAVLGDSRLQASDIAQYAISFARDNRLVAISGRSRVVNVFDVVSKEQKWALRGHTNDVRALAFSPTDDLLASSGLDRRIKLWNTATGEEKLTLLATEAMDVYALAFSPDGRWLASGSSDSLVRIWDVSIGQRRQELSGHTGIVFGLAFSSDGKLLATATDKGEVKIWNTQTWMPVAEFDAGGAVYSLAFHPTKEQLVGGMFNTGVGRVLVWDHAGTLLRSFGEKSGVVYSLTFDSAGKTLLHMQGTTCRQWNFDAGTIDLEFNSGGSYLALSPDGETIATCGTATADVRLWNRAGQTLFDRQGHDGALTALAITPDGRRILSGGQDYTLRVWDVATRQLLHTLRGHTGNVSHIACSPDGRLVATSSDTIVRMWNLSTITELPPLNGHTAIVQAVQFSPDGKRVATCGNDNTVRLWDAEIGIEKQLLTGHLTPVLDVAYSRDGVWLASSSNDGEVRVWSAGDGECRLLIKEHAAPVRALAFSPDGRFLATAGDDRQIVLVDLATGEKSASFAGHSYAVRALAFTPDGKLLVSSAAAPTDKPGELMIWDVETQIARHRMQGPLGEVFAAAVDPLGRYIASAHRNGTVEILRASARPAAASAPANSPAAD